MEEAYPAGEREAKLQCTGGLLAQTAVVKPVMKPIFNQPYLSSYWTPLLVSN
jgi:hypothetical protein